MTLYPLGADAFRSMAESLKDPCVRCDYRPGLCDTVMSEHFDGPAGPSPVHVIKSVLNHLMLLPARVVADPEPRLENCTWLASELDGRRLVRISGLSPDTVNDALIALCLNHWRPRRSISGVTPENVAEKIAEMEALAAARHAYVAETPTTEPPIRTVHAMPTPSRTQPTRAHCIPGNSKQRHLL